MEDQLDPISQSNVMKLSPTTTMSKNEITIHAIEQIFGKELDVSDEMVTAIRALQRICQANGLDPTEQAQYAFERQALYLKKWANQKKQREEKAGSTGLSERSWQRLAMKTYREEKVRPAPPK